MWVAPRSRSAHPAFPHAIRWTIQRQIATACPDARRTLLPFIGQDVDLCRSRLVQQGTSLLHPDTQSAQPVTRGYAAMLPDAAESACSADAGNLSFAVSSFCHAGGCVGVASLPDGGRAVRDTKASDGPVLRFTPAEWRAFVAGVRNGEFD